MRRARLPSISALRRRSSNNRCDPDIVYAGSRPHGLLRSDALGSRFNLAWDADGGTVWSVGVSPAFTSDTTAFVLTDHGLFRSDDG